MPHPAEPLSIQAFSLIFTPVFCFGAALLSQMGEEAAESVSEQLYEFALHLKRQFNEWHTQTRQLFRLALWGFTLGVESVAP